MTSGASGLPRSPLPASNPGSSPFLAALPLLLTPACVWVTDAEHADKLVEAEPCTALTWYTDADGDGYGQPEDPLRRCEQPADTVREAGDCDDARADIHPALAETCDGEDDDCDGAIDEDATDASAWYADADGDGAGSRQTEPQLACTAPDGKVASGTDCDDTDATIGPEVAEICDEVDQDCDGVVDEDATDATAYHPDVDADRYGDPRVTVAACRADDGYVTDATDCDDTDASVLPGAEETCNGRDDDCDGALDEPEATDAAPWYRDFDGDGFGVDDDVTPSCAAAVAGRSAAGGDCDDLQPEVSPAAGESCNGRDDDCDGEADEPDAVDASTWYADTDGDGYGDAAAATVSCASPAGFGSDGTDCDDTNAAVSPGDPERCESVGVDDDCDGQTDEDDAVDAASWYTDQDGDGWGEGTAAAPGAPFPACTQPTGAAAYDGDCDDADPDTYPGAAETCDADHDCDGETGESGAIDAGTWYRDADGDGYGDPTVAAPSCEPLAGFAASGGDCDDLDPALNPGATEECEADTPIDDDCDGDTEDAADRPTWYPDTDGDGFGLDSGSVIACAAPDGYGLEPGDCDDADADAWPGSPEWCDGVDNDCDGAEGVVVTWTPDATEVREDVTAAWASGIDGAPTRIDLVETGEIAICGDGQPWYVYLVQAGYTNVTVVGWYDVDGATAAVLDGGGAQTVVSSGAHAALRLEQVAITGGAGRVVGGVLVEEYASVTLANVQIHDNVGGYGGGVSVMTGGVATITDSTVSGNASASWGGGIALSPYGNSGASASLSDSVVSGNRANRGGGIYMMQPTYFEAEFTAITDNDAGDEGGGIYAASTSTFELQDCTLSGNRAGVRGGGIGGATSAITLRGTTVTGNDAGTSGGGVGFTDYYQSTGATLYLLAGSSLTGNTASWTGGGFANGRLSNLVCDTSSIWGNDAFIGEDLGFEVPGEFSASACDLYDPSVGSAELYICAASHDGFGDAESSSWSCP